MGRDDLETPVVRRRSLTERSPRSAEGTNPSRGIWDDHPARRDVARANLESAVNRDLDPRDPRWLVALEAASRMEGSLLSFERRRAVLAFARKVGVRPFDANLIIAAVQDRARRGETVFEAMPTVAMTARPTPKARKRRWPYICVAFVAVLAHVWILRAMFGG